MAGPDERYEEYRDEPPRRRRYGDEDWPPRRSIRRQQLSWIEQQFAHTSMVLLVLFPLCCGMVALVFGILGVAMCQDPKAKRNAIIVLTISLAWIGIVMVAVIVNRVLERPMR